MIKKTVSYKVAQDVLEEFNLLAKESAVNKSKWLENNMKQYIRAVKVVRREEEMKEKIFVTPGDTEEDGFSCPECGKQGIALNIGKMNYMYCKKCKVQWCIGMNIFESWKEEDETIWKKNAKFLEKYEEVK